MAQKKALFEEKNTIDFEVKIKNSFFDSGKKHKRAQFNCRKY
jgi:hypothetical protein